MIARDERLKARAAGFLAIWTDFLGSTPSLFAALDTPWTLHLSIPMATSLCHYRLFPTSRLQNLAVLYDGLTGCNMYKVLLCPCPTQVLLV